MKRSGPLPQGFHMTQFCACIFAWTSGVAYASGHAFVAILTLTTCVLFALALAGMTRLFVSACISIEHRAHASDYRKDTPA